MPDNTTNTPADTPANTPAGTHADTHAGTQDDFFVGYLPTPSAHKRLLLRIIIPVVLWIMAGASAVLAWQQQDPGDAIWHAQEQSIRGLVINDPYPMLLVPPGTDHQPGTYLLVTLVKRGAQDYAEPHDNTLCAATGFLLERDGRKVLQLIDDQSLQPIEPASPTNIPAVPKPIGAGRVTLTGEIMDSKCFLGAMKPGDGLTHQACAMLCIAGGIPPMLVTRDINNNPSYYLLTDTDGGPIIDPILPFVGVPVEVTGDLSRAGDTLRLAVDPDNIKYF